jgi:sugar phosphate isomerase/epimerase
LGASAATAAAISSFETLFSTNKPSFTMNENFDLKVLATNWGFHGSIDDFCAAAKKEGYDGAELWWPADNEKEQQAMFAALKKHGLQVGFLFGAWQNDPREHFNTFQKTIEAAISNKYQKPLYINCHSGKDFFSFEQNRRFIEYTIDRSKQAGVPVYHETHRGRILFAANIARQFIEQFPELRITFDVSHWCNVHESLLDDQKETIGMALERTDHIHARIGHAEGPQVNDPRAPEWENALKAHLAWWDKVIERKKKNGESMTILTEFGPADYLPTLPYTRQPVADQWAINVHMMHLLRKRYT